MRGLLPSEIYGSDACHKRAETLSNEISLAASNYPKCVGHATARDAPGDGGGKAEQKQRDPSCEVAVNELTRVSRLCQIRTVLVMRNQSGT